LFVELELKDNGSPAPAMNEAKPVYRHPSRRRTARVAPARNEANPGGGRSNTGWVW